MAKDFIPSADTKLIEWLSAFKTSAPAIAAQLGLSTSEIDQIELLCKEYIDQIKETGRALQKAKTEVTKKKAMRKTHAGTLRKLVKKMKASTNYNHTNGVNMGVLTHKEEKDWATYQPTIKARVQNDLIEIKFNKYGMDSMEFRGRPKDGDWEYIGTRSRSPFYFKPKDHAPGSLTEWEITGRAIVKDEQVGKPSEAVTVVYAPK